MRIISDFHDYYDIGMQNGIDPKLPYQRFRREEPVDIHFSKWVGNGIGFSNWYVQYYEEHCNIAFFGFAGAIYPAAGFTDGLNETTYYFDIDEIPESFYDGILENRWPWKRKREKDRAYLLKQARKELRDVFEFKNDERLTKFFETYKTAIFIYRLGDRKAIINERLNLYGFQKILPPIQAFRELEMYVGSYLTQPVIEEPPISDKIKAEIHGFGKYSFRKDKGAD